MSGEYTQGYAGWMAAARWAMAMATALGAAFNFGSIGIIVFRNADVMLLPRFLSVYVAQCAINTALLHGLEGIGLRPLLAQFLLLPLLASGTYLAMKNWVFAETSAAKAARD